ncbi:MAG: excinuclease ABC subunit UvrA, partial [Bacteroidota bacterium]
MSKEYIHIKGARAHNLKNIDLTIPRDKLVILTGLSGSGKSSLAFDTIYAEGQRRYVESLSAYARQFLGQMEKPDVDYIEGLSPAISIDQKTTSHNPRSTVGTVTEIYDYLRLLYARIGHPHCPQCGREIARQTVEQIVDQVLAMPERTKVQLLAPVIRGRKGEYTKLLEDLRKEGYVRARIDGELRELSGEITLEKYKKHDIEVVVDRLIVRPEIRGRLADSVETALKLGKGLVLVDVIDGEPVLYSENFACPECGVSIEELTPRMFSFNNPYGACPACSGLGSKMEVDPETVIDPAKPIALGGILAWGNSVWNGDDEGYIKQMLGAVVEKIGFSLVAPLKDATPEQLRAILYGLPGETIRFSYTNFQGRARTIETQYEGVVNNLERRYRETGSEYMRQEIEKFMRIKPCVACQGARLRRESLAVTVGGLNIRELTALTVLDARSFLASLELTDRERTIAHQILKEIQARLGFLVNVGLDYLTLDRAAGSLSGGEAQRIRLATQIGSSLVGVLYILDEPSIGLHQRDNQRLIDTLKGLRDLGNTLIVVEHDEAMMRQGDFLVDIGPGAG